MHARCPRPMQGQCMHAGGPKLLRLRPALRTPASPKPRVAAPSGPPGGGLRRSSRSEAELGI
eukprot:scaffold73375_cov105-Phaeocystis_antarctica.AAC.3